MPAKHAAALFGRVLSRPLEEVDEGVAVGGVESEGGLLSRHRHLLHVLTQLDLRLPVDLDQLVHAAQGGLALAGHCKSRKKINCNY